MAITYVSAAEDVYNSPTPIGSRTVSAVNIGTRTNGLLVVGVSCQDASPGNTPDISGVTWNAVSMTKGKDQVYTSSNDDYLAEIWHLADPDDATVGDGAHDCVVTFTASTITKSYIVLSWYDGAKQTGVYDNSNSGTGTTDPSITLLPTENNCLIVGHYTSEANAPLTVGGETAILDEDWGAQVAGASYVIQTTATTQTVDWSGQDGNYAIVAVSFKQAAAAPTLTVADGSHTHQAETQRLYQAHTLKNMADGSHTQTSDAFRLYQQHTLTGVADGQHTHTAESMVLIKNSTLVVQDGSHTHTSETQRLYQAHTVVVQDGSHTQTAESVVLTQQHSLTVQDGQHSHQAENVTLDAGGAITLVVQDGSHTHLADGPFGVPQHHLLAVQDGSHTQQSDAFRLYQAHTLAVQDGQHSNQADILLLFQAHFIALVLDGQHSHLADGVLVEGPVLLVVQDGVHGHYADTLSWGRRRATSIAILRRMTRR